MDRDTADQIVQRTGIASVMYYPQIHADDIEFKLSDDVDWCLETATALADADREQLREVISRTIIDPTGHREQLTETVYGLVAGTAE